MWVPTLIDYLYKKVLRPGITWPAFVYNYPKTMQPLARQNDANPDIVEQFQVVVNGWEICKAYSELVDPESKNQLWSSIWSYWKMRWRSYKSWWRICTCNGIRDKLPQSGFGMWIDRVFSLLTAQENLRDVVLFPLMKTKIIRQ